MRDVQMSSIRAVDRAIDVLNVFNHHDAALTIDEITSRVDIPKATVYRILYTLERRRLVSFDSQTLKYRLGFKLMEYADVVSSTLDIRKVAEPFLEELYQRTHQTVFMSIVEDDHLIYVYRQESKEGLKVTLFEGPQRPLVYGAFGYVSLAFMDEEKLNVILSREIPQFTPSTMTDKSVVMHRLMQIRDEHIFMERDEAIQGVTGVAAPVFDGKGRFMAAAGVNGPTVTMVEPRLSDCIEAVRETAKNISVQLGYRG